MDGYVGGMKPFLIRWLITTVAVLVASTLVPGIEVTGGIVALVAASLFLGIINALVRPVLLLLSIPLILVTMGLFMLVLNALLLWMVGGLVPGFSVGGFWSAFFGALLVSLTSWVMSAFFRDSDGRIQVLTHHTQVRREPPRRDVIDV